MSAIGASGGEAATTIAAVAAVLPEGFSMPPIAYAIVLGVGLLAVVVTLWTLSPPVTDRTVIALATWMMVGGVMHALYQIREFPPVVEPLLGTPAVYATMAVVAGTVWIVSTLYAATTGRTGDVPLALLGGGVLTVLVVWGHVLAFQAETLRPLPAVVSMGGAAFVTAATWLAISLYFTEAAALTSWSGAVVVGSHALDGMTTAVGHDMLAVGERTPVAERILEAGEMLPTAQYIGAGWLFLFVKLLVAAAVVVLFREWVREEPRRARLGLAGVAAVGLGPGTYNLLLFAIGRV